jgi:pimeloyl-ACP methyl ester carboxylesterase
VTDQPTVVLVHGPFSETSSWTDVIDQLERSGFAAVAVANPLRSVSDDAAYLRDVIAALDTRVLLVGHSYGGMIVTEASSQNSAVVGLVYVAALAPDQSESALQLCGLHPGSTLESSLTGYPISSGGCEFRLRYDAYREQFAADVPPRIAAKMARTQRPVTEYALSEGLPTSSPGWTTLPSWFVYGELDHIIPAAVARSLARRARAYGSREIPGGSHALTVSRPFEVAQTITSALEVCARADVA